MVKIAWVILASCQLTVRPQFDLTELELLFCLSSRTDNSGQRDVRGR
jgi:hypothetical protein